MRRCSCQLHAGIRTQLCRTFKHMNRWFLITSTPTVCGLCCCTCVVSVLQLLQEPDQVGFALLNMMTAVLAQVRAALFSSAAARQGVQTCLQSSSSTTTGSSCGWCAPKAVARVLAKSACKQQLLPCRSVWSCCPRLTHVPDTIDHCLEIISSCRLTLVCCACMRCAGRRCRHRCSA